eukprot:jgi/Psemu1/44927/gm1.44927_g
MNHNHPKQQQLSLCRPPTKLILKGTPEELSDLAAQKILKIAARFRCRCRRDGDGGDDDDDNDDDENCLPKIACETATAEECRKESHLARSLVLLLVYGDNEKDNDVVAVATSRAMMRAIASISGTSTSTSRTAAIAEDAMIHGWLNYVWTCVDVPLQRHQALTLSSLRVVAAREDNDNINNNNNNNNNAHVVANERAAIEADLSAALKTIDRHLSKQRSPSSRNTTNDNDNASASANTNTDRPLCIVETTASTACGGERTATSETYNNSYTLADWSLAVSLHYMVENHIAVAARTREENPHLFDWYQSVVQAELELELD